MAHHAPLVSTSEPECDYRIFRRREVNALLRCLVQDYQTPPLTQPPHILLLSSLSPFSSNKDFVCSDAGESAQFTLSLVFITCRLSSISLVPSLFARTQDEEEGEKVSRILQPHPTHPVRSFHTPPSSLARRSSNTKTIPTLFSGSRSPPSSPEAEADR